MFLKIDNWLFDKVFQPFADWFTDHTGRNVHWIAATCAYLYGACIVVKQVYFRSDSWFGITLDVILLLLMLTAAQRHDRQSTTHTSLHMNPYRTDSFFQFMRVLGIPIFFLNLSDFLRNNTESSEDLFRSFSSLLFLCII